MDVAVTTHGCRLNRAESDAMAQLLRGAGHRVVEDPTHADVVVLNTCTITHRADADARSAVRRLTRRGARVVLTGCFVDADATRAAALPGVSAVLGNADKGEVVAAVGHAVAHPPEARAPADNGVRSPIPHPEGPAPAEPTVGASTFVHVSALTRKMPMTDLPAAVAGRARALLKVQDGCNYRCSFCIVPSVRGGSRSMPVPEVTGQLRALVEAGAPEVVLTGIHLGTWGRDLRPRQTIADLVRGVLPHLATARLRLSSIDPHEVDDALLTMMAAQPDTICAHLHLPVQSADDATLVAMRRGHNCDDFTRSVTDAARRLVRPSIGTDVIAGFPGESDAAFDRTVAQLRALPLTYLHVFPFSRRRGTPAETMEQQVDPAEIARRCQVLRTLSDDKAAAFRRRHAGTTADVVVHKQPGRHRARGTWPALSSNYLQVELSAHDGERLAGQRVLVALADDGRTATPVR